METVLKVSFSFIQLILIDCKQKAACYNQRLATRFCKRNKLVLTPLTIMAIFNLAVIML